MEQIQYSPFPVPVVSVIVPCYNHGHFLAEALESVLAQSWQLWECIVVDDGSTDDTRQVVEAFVQIDTRFQYLHQSNQGLSAARNAGIAVCKGSYIQFLDADDMLEEEKLEAQIVYLEKHPETDIVYGNVRYFKEPIAVPIAGEIGKHSGKRMPQVSGAGLEMLYPLVQKNIMVVNAPLLRRSVTDDVDGFNETLRGHEDWDYWIRCALAGKRFQFVNEDSTLALVRVRDSSMSKNVLPMLMSHVRVREQLQNGSLPSDLRKENRFRTGIIYSKIARFELVNGKLIAGLKHAVLAVWLVSVNISIGILLQLPALLLPERISARVESAAGRRHMLP